jgi:SPP1 gp7 family putative phage head morphogenesis protein
MEEVLAAIALEAGQQALRSARARNLRTIAASRETRLLRSVLRYLRRARVAARGPATNFAISFGNRNGIVRIAEQAMMHTAPRLVDVVKDDLEFCYLAARQMAGSRLQRDEGIRVLSPWDDSAIWADVNAALLVQNLTAETRRAIQQLVSRAFRDGIAPEALAQLLKNMTGLGLTTTQISTMVATFEAMTAALPGKVVWVGKDRLVTPSGGWPTQTITERLEQLSETMLLQRARMIARTELIAASAAGQQAMWRRAVTMGWLRGDERRRWSAAHDERLCPECGALHGQEVGLEEPFIGPEGEVFQPPAHPNCRCSVVLAI